MLKSNKRKILLPTLFIVTLVATLFLAVAAVYADLPDRDRPADNPQKNEGRGVSGSYIELLSSVGPWAVVQWQDINGNWNDVEGWQGTLPNNYQRWWVAPKDFGTGPFRWEVREGPTGRVLGVSSAFNLPPGGDQGLTITIAR